MNSSSNHLRFDEHMRNLDKVELQKFVTTTNRKWKDSKERFCASLVTSQLQAAPPLASGCPKLPAVWNLDLGIEGRRDATHVLCDLISEDNKARGCNYSRNGKEMKQQAKRRRSAARNSNANLGEWCEKMRGAGERGERCGRIIWAKVPPKVSHCSPHLEEYEP